MGGQVLGSGVSYYVASGSLRLEGLWYPPRLSAGCAGVAACWILLSSQSRSSHA